MKRKEFGPGLSPKVDVYLGIDQSYSGFGMAFLGADGSYHVTVAQFTNRGVKRLIDIHEHMIYEITNVTRYGHALRDVAMEGYAYGSQMANMAGELGATVKLGLYGNYNIHPLIVPPTTLKKYVTGKGNGVKKSQMMLAVYKKWDAELLDDNAADAYALARIASGKADTAYEQDIINMLQNDKYREA